MVPLDRDNRPAELTSFVPIAARFMHASFAGLAE